MSNEATDGSSDEQDIEHVIIVGAGAIGVSTAYHLAGRGVNVTLLDKGHAAGETTGKAGGLVYGQLHHPTDVRICLESLAFFREFAADARNFTFHETGFLRLGGEDERPIFEREVQMQREQGANVRLLDRDEIASLEPNLDLDGVTVGTYSPDDGHVDPHSFATALLRAGEDRGVDYRPKTPVEAIDVVDDRVQAVHAGGDRLETDAVVVAAGPWSKAVADLAGIDLPLKPYRTQALVTDDVDFEMGCVYDAIDGVYFRPESGGLLAGDGTDEREFDPDDYAETADFDFMDTVGATLRRRLPVDEVGVRNSWAGLSSATPDGFPLVGRPPKTPGGDEFVEGLFVGAGLQGHGVMRSPGVGNLLAELVLGDGADPYADYLATRFDADPGAFEIHEMMKLER